MRLMVGGWVRPRRPRIVVRAWEGVAAAAAPKVCMTAVGGRHAWVPKVGKIGDGTVVAGP
jgi:hypothetical protein